MSEGHHHHREEKDEEKDEKEDEKRKGRDEKWRRDRVNALLWALVLIWGALVILAETTGYAKDNFSSWWEGWAVFFVGAGAILLLTAFYRLLVPEHRRAITGNVIIGLVLLAIGLGDLISWNYIWVIVLIAIALMILLRAFLPRGER